MTWKALGSFPNCCEKHCGEKVLIVHGGEEDGGLPRSSRSPGVLPAFCSEAYRELGLFGTHWLTLDFCEKAANKRRKQLV